MKRRRRKRLASKLDAMVRQTEREISRRAFVALIVYSQRLLVGAGMTVDRCLGTRDAHFRARERGRRLWLIHIRGFARSDALCVAVHWTGQHLTKRSNFKKVAPGGTWPATNIGIDS